jgi:hypothetical protein
MNDGLDMFDCGSQCQNICDSFDKESNCNIEMQENCNCNTQEEIITLEQPTEETTEEETQNLLNSFLG